MGNQTTHAGELDRRVELFKFEVANSDTSEKKRTATSLGKIWANRGFLSGGEEEDGKLVSLSVERFTIRFNRAIFTDGVQYFIRDIDGDFYVNSTALSGSGNRFLILKCSKNG